MKKILKTIGLGNEFNKDNSKLKIKMFLNKHNMGHYGTFLVL